MGWAINIRAAISEEIRIKSEELDELSVKSDELRVAGDAVEGKNRLNIFSARK
jgi:hypothetical protein